MRNILVCNPEDLVRFQFYFTLAQCDLEKFASHPALVLSSLNGYCLINQPSEPISILTSCHSILVTLRNVQTERFKLSSIYRVSLEKKATSIKAIRKYLSTSVSLLN